MSSMKKEIFIYYLLSIIYLPLGFLIRLFFSRTISIQDVGIIYSLISFYSLLILFIRFGMPHALKYYIPKFYYKKKLTNIRNLFQYSLIIQVVLMFIYLIFFFFFLDIII